MKHQQIIIINGNGGVGKDTFIRVLSSVFRDVDIWSYSTIDKVKEIAKMIGWDGVKDEKGRKLLADLKSLCDSYNDMTFKDMKQAVSEFKNSYGTLLFIHIREPHNIDRAKDEFDAITMLVTRDSVENITSNDADKHVAEYDYDYVVNNNGNLVQLELEAKKFLQYINNIMRNS